MELFGIKNCDSVKKARKWLDAREIDYTFHDLKQAAPDKVQLQRWCQAVGWETLLNRRGLTWRQLDEAQKQDLDTPMAIELMQHHPMLIKRPVIQHGDQLLVGFKEADYEQHFG